MGRPIRPNEGLRGGWKSGGGGGSWGEGTTAAGGQRGTTGCVHWHVCVCVRERENNAYIMRCLAGKTQYTDRL